MEGNLAPNEKLIDMRSILFCPYCKKEITSLLEVHDRNIPTKAHVQRLTTIVFACPNGRVILGNSKLYY